MIKKITKFFLLFLVLSIVPIVHAEELPREGVTYFLTYPDGREEITESYDEATNSEELLLYEGPNGTGTLTIHSLEIMYQGSEVLSVSNNDLSEGFDLYTSNTYMYQINDVQKNEILQEFINHYYTRDNCLVQQLCEY